MILKVSNLSDQSFVFVLLHMFKTNKSVGNYDTSPLSIKALRMPYGAQKESWGKIFLFSLISQLHVFSLYNNIFERNDRQQLALKYDTRSRMNLNVFIIFFAKKHNFQICFLFPIWASWNKHGVFIDLVWFLYINIESNKWYIALLQRIFTF